MKICIKVRGMEKIKWFIVKMSRGDVSFTHFLYLRRIITGFFRETLIKALP